jgi:hypothetical protein
MNNIVSTLVDALIVDRTMYSATKYLTPKKVVRVTRRLKGSSKATREEFVVTIGAPNYLAVKFIKQCVKAKEPFPVLKIQFKKWPIKKKAKK